ncbi:MAG TPA: site-specific DNA-methyltransferase [Alicyclobacillus sp.]|nr:site-specific DNA-methyltransferase [Alicyclobacillus sp.]
MQVNTINQIVTNEYALYHGDCVEITRGIPDNSIHYSIFSPPFASLYTYSNSDRDMGNSRSDEEFFTHFRFLIRELYRVTMPGRLASIHCMNLPTSKANHGYIGIRDFRGDIIRAFEEEGWIYHSEVVIWKDPVVAQQRTKALGLLHKQLVKDSAMSRQGIPDYLVTMRKPGENPEPISGCFDCYYGEMPEPDRAKYTTDHDNRNWYSIEVWQRYASPVWFDIRPNDTLQYRSAREQKDERHICPLQLTVIARGIDLWSNPGDTVFSPFMGIGSEGYQAVKMGRRFVGIELKESYFKLAVNNLQMAVQESIDSIFAGLTLPSLGSDASCNTTDS